MKFLRPFLLCLPILFFFACSSSDTPSVEIDRFEKEVLVSASRDAIQFEILPNGDIVFCEFWGLVKRYDAETGRVKTLGQIETYAKGEVGLLGMAVARDFSDSGNLYALFCPAEKQGTMRVSRFPVEGDKLQTAKEEILLSWPYDTEHVYHMGGAMCTDGKGNLYIGNGDNCHWNPGLPLDFRPGKKSWDALRSAGNSKDHRGKILRIRPDPGKGYQIPEGNLFTDPADGLPEIYAMGVRNPFRMVVDDTTGTLYFGDVGPNVLPEVGIEPLGYEEINATQTAGNFGWPLFIGPNESYPIFDFEKNQPIETYDPAKPVNKSPNNTGLKKLPPAKPALIWYSTTASERFPTLGSGGRSIMAGPVYHFDENNPSAVKLPATLDGRLFIYEWMRNWIQTVDLESDGPAIEPFLPDLSLRRPVDMKFGPDGALYFIEYGDVWWENPDSQIVRIVYRRGNRPPKAIINASETAGKQPLTVTLDASDSTDPDGDDLTFSWKIAGNDQTLSSEPRFEHTFEEPGDHRIELTLSDGSDASGTAQEFQVGNSRPDVRLNAVRHGGFFDWEEEIPYEVVITDSDSAAIDPNRIAVHGEFRPRRFDTDDLGVPGDPGLALMRGSTCFACHLADTASAGPPYRAVAEKYREEPAARDVLAQKIISGTTGAWGELPMPPHPQHTPEQTGMMVDWILSLGGEDAAVPQSGPSGIWKAPKQPESRGDQGVLILTASYTDLGADDAGPLRGEAIAVLHSPKKKAAFFDENDGMLIVENVEGEKGMLGHFEDGDSIVFRDLDLSEVGKVNVRAGGIRGKAGRFELRQDSPDGPLLVEVAVSPTGETEFPEVAAELNAEDGGLTDVCVVAHCAEGEILGLNWIEFLPKGSLSSTADFDLLITNARIADGSGAPLKPGKVAIKGDRIVAIGESVEGTAATTIDAGGKVVAPGFIDVHTHSESICALPEAENFIRMGVTTIVTGNCGGSKTDVAEFFDDIEKMGVTVNVATLIGHNSVRREVMGGSFIRPPKAAEIQEMRRLVEQAMKDGAVGLSTGLIYNPGTFAKTEEVIELAKAASAHGGIYVSHMRAETVKIFSALDELIRIAREANIPAEVSHIKVTGPTAWGKSEEVLAVLDKARAEGLQITHDAYTYTASSTGLRQLIPDEAREGTRDDYRARIADPEQKAKILEGMREMRERRGSEDYSYAVIARFRADESLNGLTIPEAAEKIRGSSSLEDQIELILDIEAQGGGSGIYHGMTEEDLQNFLRHPKTLIASDGGPRRFGEDLPHPRSYGNAARAIARYVRELKVLELEDAIRRMTSLPAETFQLTDRGVIRPGAFADLVIFDPEKVNDPAAFDDPHHYAEGFSEVIVNGEAVILGGKLTGVRSGGPLRLTKP